MSNQQATDSSAVPTFAFGKNWRKYLSRLTPEKIELAKSALAEFVGRDAIRGKTFLDIGCGSGIHSYAALELGASRVVSFDFDADAVECCKTLWSRAGNPNNWIILQGSILDDSFVRGLGAFDLVYSWGVLHHTGEMWRAIKSSANLVGKGGLLYIAIYNRVDSPLGSGFWLQVKKTYNSSSRAGRVAMETMFLSYYSIMNLGARAISYSRREKGRVYPRGMELRTDVLDWIGGYPYEFATSMEIRSYVQREFPSFDLVRISETYSLGNNLFLWKRTG